MIGIGAGVIFKGSGFWQTDYRSESYKKAAEADKKSASEGKTDGAVEKGDKGAKGEKSAAADKPAEAPKTQMKPEKKKDSAAGRSKRPEKND